MSSSNRSIISLGLALIGVVAATASVGCSGDDTGLNVAAVPGGAVAAPGSTPFESTAIQCDSDSDCGPGEACMNDLCAMNPCPSQVPKVPPMGVIFKMFADDELLMLKSGAGRAESFRVIDKSFRPDNTDFDIPNTALDVAGGPVITHRPNSLVVANGTREVVVLTAGKDTVKINLDFEVSRVDTGDMDNDGYEEVIALGTGGSAICYVKSNGGCEPIPVGAVAGNEDSTATDGTAAGNDITVADVDGDGKDEALIVSSSELILWSPLNDRALRYKSGGGRHVSAGDIDEDGVDEVFIASGDTVRAFRVLPDKLELAGAATEGGIKDIAVMDLDDDQKADLMILSGSDGSVYRGNPNGLEKWYSAPFADSYDRVAIMDADGDSAIGTYQYGPETFVGPLIPQNLLIYPPYWQSFSDVGQIRVAFGVTESEKMEETESVSFGTSLTIGFETEVDIPIVSSIIGKPKVLGGLKQTWKKTEARGFSVTVKQEDRWGVQPDVNTFGPDSAGVIVGATCFNYYEYLLSDPFDKLGETPNDIMPVMLPMATSTLVLSLKRYNAMAEPLGMPVIRVPYVTGDPTSYPREVEKIDGTSIDPEDIIFGDDQYYSTSDIASTDFRRYIEESNFEKLENKSGLGRVLEVKGIRGLGAGFVTKFLATSGAAGAGTLGLASWAAISAGTGGEVGNTGVRTEMAYLGGASSLLGVGVGKFDSTVEKGIAYKMSFGKRSAFYGRVARIVDNPSTPEDETLVYGYEYSPVVYRHRYTNVLGEEQSILVQTYVVRFKDD